MGNPRIVSVKPVCIDGTLELTVLVRRESGRTVRCRVPDRVIAALIPRSILIGSENRITSEIWETITTIARVFLVGRCCRVRRRRGIRYIGFLPWTRVRLTDSPRSCSRVQGR